MTEAAGRPGPKYRQIAGTIRARIASRQYPAGKRLPTKDEMAAEYQAAPGTIDRALEELRKAGLAETIQGSGTFVRDPGAPERSPEFRELEPRIAAVEAGDEREVLRREIERLRREVEAIQVDVMELYAKLGYEQPSHEQDGRKVRHEDAG